jgi:hypothetical protein
MRETRQSGSEGGARFNPSLLPLSRPPLPGRRVVVFASLNNKAGKCRNARLDKENPHLYLPTMHRDNLQTCSHRS